MSLAPCPRKICQSEWEANAARPIKALLFDFDGVIIETELPGYLGWQKIYADHGQTLTLEQFALVIGTHFLQFDPRKDLEAKVGRPLDWETLDRQRREHDHAIIKAQSVMPGVAELITEAESAGIKAGIVSSSPRDWIAHWLRHANLWGRFAMITCIDDVPTPKPAPDLYLAALKRFGISAAETVAIEDSPNGSKAAQSAGLFCVVVPSEITARLRFEVDFPRVASLQGITIAQMKEMKRAYWNAKRLAVNGIVPTPA
jgi:HAD superfamily hydrolase (TIGR01509 family)